MLRLRDCGVVGVVLFGLTACVGSHSRDPDDGSISPDADLEAGMVGADGSMGADGSISPDAGLDAGTVVGAVLPGTSCWDGTATPCMCPDGREGLLFCVDTEWLDECECAPVPVPWLDAGPLPDAAFGGRWYPRGWVDHGPGCMHG